MNAIEIRDLRMSFGPQVVLDGIDLTVRRGSVFALLGPNGAGKTTMINILSTLLRPVRSSVVHVAAPAERDRDRIAHRTSK